MTAALRWAHPAPRIVASVPRAPAVRTTSGQSPAGPPPGGRMPPGPGRSAGITAIPAPQWRTVLEARWQARLRKVIELSVAYHDSADLLTQAGHHNRDHAGSRQLRQLLRQAITARRALADTEEALTRLSAGRYGLCEQCAAIIPPRRLALTPETRYCPRCAPGRQCHRADRRHTAIRSAFRHTPGPRHRAIQGTSSLARPACRPAQAEPSR